MTETAYVLWTMPDDFYEKLQIPALPLPLLQEDLDQGLKAGFPFQLITHNLQDYLASQPGKAKAYQPVLARMAYEAGVSAGRHHQFEIANSYFKMACQYEPENATFLVNLGRSHYDLGDIFSAAAAYREAVTIFAAKFVPDVWLMLAKILFELGEHKAGEAAVEDYLTRLELLAPEHYLEFCEHGRQWSLRNEADPSMLTMFEDAISKAAPANEEEE